MTHQLLFATASPYSSKVRMAALHAGVALELIAVEPSKGPAGLLQANPLAKIPVLLPPGKPAVYDSRAITHYLDRVSGGRLFPTEPDARTAAEVLEGLGDGLCDALLAHVYERRYRPEPMVHQPWLDRQWERALRVLRSLAASPPAPEDLHAGVLAVRAALGYLALRFPGTWVDQGEPLVDWSARFDAKYPEMAACLPR